MADKKTQSVIDAIGKGMIDAMDKDQKAMEKAPKKFGKKGVIDDVTPTDADKHLE